MLPIYLIFFGILGATSDYCQPEYVLGDFPEQIAKDLFQGIAGGDPEFHGCPDETFDPSGLGFWYNRDSSTPAELLDLRDPKVSPNRRLVFLVHGWLCNITSDLMPELMEAYFKRYRQDVAVVRLEYTGYTNVSYADSYCKVPKIAEVAAKFLCQLYGKLLVKPGDTHVIGHSLGGQIVGFIGKQVQVQCGQKVQRVTGLDPARPLYQNALPANRLYKTDAEIVEVIHTNQKQAGFLGPCGTVDFYPNGGFFQPNSMRVSKATTLEELKPLPLDIILRSHLLAPQYYVEAVLYDTFKATSCTYLTPEVCVEDTLFAAETVMGESYPKFKGAKSNFVVDTNGFSPFSREYVANGTVSN